MINVIKHGNLPKPKEITTKCPECGCIFTFNLEEDTYHCKFSCRDLIDCPDCGNKIAVRGTGSFDDYDKILCEQVDYVPEA